MSIDAANKSHLEGTVGATVVSNLYYLKFYTLIGSNLSYDLHHPMRVGYFA